MQFEVDEYVMYRYSGICRIDGVEKKCFDGVNETSYYKLKPIDNAHSSCYVPVESAGEKIRKLLTEKEIYALIDSMPEEDEIWFDNSKERKVMFSKILRSDDYKVIIGMTKALYRQQKKYIENGKKLSSSDEMVMKNAEKIMYQEFSLVLGIDTDKIEETITNRIGNA
ncbi:MAG: CarD family transcriptional regulator [Porcipelethomonas sp.]